MPARREDIDLSELIFLYEVEGMSMSELADYFGISKSFVWFRLYENNADIRSTSEARSIKFWANARKYSINENFFSSWTSESAWLYGWFLGDGYYLSDHTGIGFTLEVNDEELLVKFKELLDSDKPIAYRHRLRKGTLCRNANVYFSSVVLASSIEQLDYLDIPSCLLSDFIRGFFEAEGSVYWHKYNKGIKDGHIESKFTNSDMSILDYIRWTLQEFNIIEGGSWKCIPEGKHGYTKDCWELIFGITDSISLYYYLYNTCKDLLLKRKKDKFEELIGRELSYK